MDRGIEGNIVEAEVGDQIDLENRVFGVIISCDQGYWWNVIRGALAENFFGAL